MTGCTSGGYAQLETSPEAIEQELRPAVCERRQTDLWRIIVSTRRAPVQRAALSGMKYPTRESPASDAASPISTTNLVAITVAPSTGRQ